MIEKKFCGKRRHWMPAEGGTGSGRTWRCAACSTERAAAAKKRIEQRRTPA